MAAHRSSNRLQHRSTFSEPVLVAHVKHGYEERRRSIERQLDSLGIEFEFMLDGDIADIDEEMWSRWFAGRFGPGPSQSCSCKHLLMYRRIAEAGWPGALILEDDIFLAGDFATVFEASLAELRERDLEAVRAAWISYENSTLRTPPWSELRRGRYLYRAMVPRCTGAYYIGAGAAQALLHAAETIKVDTPIDMWVTAMAKRLPDDLHIYWCHPTVAEQGSMNGRFDSMDSRRTASIWRRAKWTADKWYKSVLRWAA